MPSSEVHTFGDPEAFHAAIRAERVEGVVTARGEFRAELTRVDFDRLLMQRAHESLPRVLNLATHPKKAAIMFATDQAQPTIHVSGVALSRGEILVWDSGLACHHRSAADCQWGTMSLPQEDLAAAGEAITGREVAPPPFPRRITPPAQVFSRLLNLHEAVWHLANTAPDVLAKLEVGRAMEQGLMEAMVLCFASGDPVHERSAYRHHTRVMRRFEQVLQANLEGPFYMTELCAAVGVSHSTLRACCQEHLGMGPKRYLLLRRMHLARRALLRGGPESTTVTEIATNYGFWELGRFAVAYRSLFGELPSAALRRPPKDPKFPEITGRRYEFAKTA
jgi:AraC-like DNA-binding protein